MEGVAPLVNYVKKYIPLTEEEEAYFISLLRVAKVKKKQYIHQPGYVCQYRNYVLKGALRAFVLDNDGQEHTISVAIEDWWISDPASFVLQEPGTFFVEAVEDSTIAKISYEVFAGRYPQLLERFPLYIIASYLGMTREFLSKIRNRDAGRGSAKSLPATGASGSKMM